MAHAIVSIPVSTRGLMALFRHPHRRRRSGIPVKNSATGSIDTGVYNTSREEPPSAREFGPARFTKPAVWYANGIVGFNDGTTARVTMA